MNVAAHQEKEKNEETGKSEAGEKRKQVINFKEAAGCSGGNTGKNGLCEESAWGNWDPQEGLSQHFDPI